MATKRECCSQKNITSIYSSHVTAKLKKIAHWAASAVQKLLFISVINKEKL